MEPHLHVEFWRNVFEKHGLFRGGSLNQSELHLYLLHRVSHRQRTG